MEKTEGKEMGEEKSAGAEDLISWSKGHRVTPIVDGVEEVALIPCKQNWFGFGTASTTAMCTCIYTWQVTRDHKSTDSVTG
jgi:hypothetical protein